MGAQAQKKDAVMYWVHVFITIGLMVSGFFMKGTDIITPYGMQAIMIFAGMMWGWIFWNLSCPSLLAMAFLSLTQFGSILDIMKNGMGSEIVLMVIVLTTFGTWAQHCGLSATVARWMLSVKAVQNRPWLLITFILAMAYIVAFFVGIYVTIFTFWPIVYTLMMECGYPKKSREGAYLLVGIAYVVSLGGLLIKPYGAWSLIAIKAMNSVVPDAAIGYGLFMEIMLPVSIVCFAAYIVLGRLLLRLDVSKLASFKASNEKTDFNFEQKVCSVILLLLVFCLFAPSFLPASWLPVVLLTKLGTLGIGAVLLVIMCTIRRQDKPLVEMASVFAKGTPWDMVWLLAANTVVASALLSAEGGVRTFLGTFVATHLGGLSPIMFIVVLLVMNIALTQIAHNTVLLMVLTPIYVQIGVVIGVSPLLIPLLCSVSLSAAMATPGASSRAGLFFGNSEWIAKKDAYLFGCMSVLAVIIGLLVMVPLGMVLL